MLTGQVPFRGDNPWVVMNARLHHDPESPRATDPEISPAHESILLRALQRDPEARYASARDLSHDLEHPEQVAPAAPAQRRKRGSWLSA